MVVSLKLTLTISIQTIIAGKGLIITGSLTLNKCKMQTITVIATSLES